MLRSPVEWKLILILLKYTKRTILSTDQLSRLSQILKILFSWRFVSGQNIKSGEQAAWNHKSRARGQWAPPTTVKSSCITYMVDWDNLVFDPPDSTEESTTALSAFSISAIIISFKLFVSEMARSSADFNDFL